MKASKADHDEAIKQLRKWLKPGSTVLTVLRHVSASGMTRRIDLYTIRKGELVYLSGYAATVLGMKRHKDQGIIVGGCGMDMGFGLVYNLSRKLFPDGFIPAKVGKSGRNGANANSTDSDGGYALNQRWI